MPAGPARTARARPGGGFHSEFEVSEWDEVVTRPDNFFPELAGKPDAAWHIIIYGGQGRSRGEAQALAACVKGHVFDRRGFV